MFERMKIVFKAFPQLLGLSLSMTFLSMFFAILLFSLVGCGTNSHSDTAIDIGCDSITALDNRSAMPGFTVDQKEDVRRDITLMAFNRLQATDFEDTALQDPLPLCP
jgi:hypothetical protein